MTAEWSIFVRRGDRTLIGQVDDYASAEIILRHNLPGSWVINGVNQDSEGGVRLRSVALTDNRVGGIVIDRDGEVFVSGPLTTYRRQRATDDDGFVTDIVTVAGPDDLVELWGRRIHPSPSTLNFAAAAEDVRSGAAETVMHGYVNAHAGPGAHSTRRVDGLVLAADGARGASLTERARLDVLGELLAAIAIKGGGLGFRLRQNDDNNLEFAVYEPSALADAIVLSDDVGNLGDFTLEVTGPELTQTWVGGGGEGTARTFVERLDGDLVTRWGRREGFRDRRDTIDTTEMALTGDEELANGGERISLEVNPVDLTNLTFGVDYGLGDQITAEVDGVEVVQIIREVHITVDADGEHVVPILGSAAVTGGTDPIFDLYDRLRRLSTRTNNLERR